VTLATAIGLGAGEVVALVGAGGKTTALRLLAAELTANGSRVITTTTTAMLVSEMEAVGPVLRLADGGEPGPRLTQVLGEGRRAAVAQADGEHGKVVGLAPGDVDGLWALGVADYLLVEADGSRGLPLKAFGADEPQVPAAATTVVVVAGLDVLGAPLTEARVHRAAVLAELLRVPLGGAVTTLLMADALRAQVARLRRTGIARRLVVLLNKADTPVALAAGTEVARVLLGRRGEKSATSAAADPDEGHPDRIVVGSLWQSRFTVLAGAA
jgi:molybdenum cofactor cytidylyltransferase